MENRSTGTDIKPTVEEQDKLERVVVTGLSKNRKRNVLIQLPFVGAIMFFKVLLLKLIE